MFSSHKMRNQQILIIRGQRKWVGLLNIWSYIHVSIYNSNSSAGMFHTLWENILREKDVRPNLFFFPSPSRRLNVTDMPLHLWAFPWAHGGVTLRTRAGTIQAHCTYSCHYGVNNPGSQCIHLRSLITCISLWRLDTPPLIKKIDGGRSVCSPGFQICPCLERCLLESTWETGGGGGCSKSGERQGWGGGEWE